MSDEHSKRESEESEGQKPVPFDEALRRILKTPPKHKEGEKREGGKKPAKTKTKKARQP